MGRGVGVDGDPLGICQLKAIPVPGPHIAHFAKQDHDADKDAESRAES